MFKVIILLKRRDGMTFEDFVSYYEHTHAKLGQKALPTAERYFRRYLTPFSGSGEAAESDVDVITEIWFRDKAAFEKAMAHLQQPALAKEIAEDEERLLDRSKIRFFTVEERESLLGRVAT